MAAQFVDALIGYEYFLEKRGKMSLQEINDYLIHKSNRPVSLRMYGHYKKLIAYGFRSYVPINKFDVYQSLGSLQLASDRRRFNREKENLKIFISKDRLKWFEGMIVDRSLVGLGLVTKERFPMSTGVNLYLRIPGYEEIPVIGVWKKHLENNTRIGVRAIKYLAQYKLEDVRLEEEYLKGELRISRESDEDLGWDNLFRVLSRAQELIVSVSDLIYTIDDVVGGGAKLANPVLESISFGSPGSAHIKIDQRVAKIMEVVIEEINNIYLDYTNEKEILYLRNDIKHGRKTKRKDRVHEGLIDRILKRLKETLGVNELPTTLFEEGSPEMAVLTERIQPAAISLVYGDDPNYQIDVSQEE